MELGKQLVVGDEQDVVVGTKPAVDLGIVWKTIESDPPSPAKASAGTDAGLVEQLAHSDASMTKPHELIAWMYGPDLATRVA